jgi:hypothetical protein
MQVLEAAAMRWEAASYRATAAFLPTIVGWLSEPDDDLAAHAAALLAWPLYRSNAAAYACGYVGLRPPNARPITGPPHAWVLLPERDYWHDSIRS